MDVELTVTNNEQCNPKYAAVEYSVSRKKCPPSIKA